MNLYFARDRIENIEEIVAVDGLDMIMIGLGDLLADMVDAFSEIGEYGAYPNVEMMALVRQAEDIVKASNKWLARRANP